MVKTLSQQQLLSLLICGLGYNNITHCSACVSRFRIHVRDKNLCLNDDFFLGLGIKGIVHPSETEIHLITEHNSLRLAQQLTNTLNIFSDSKLQEAFTALNPTYITDFQKKDSQLSIFFNHKINSTLIEEYIIAHQGTVQIFDSEIIIQAPAETLDLIALLYKNWNIFLLQLFSSNIALDKVDSFEIHGNECHLHFFTKQNILTECFTNYHININLKESSHSYTFSPLSADFLTILQKLLNL